MPLVLRLFFTEINGRVLAFEVEKAGQKKEVG
jgi:hypothetical protein